MRKIVDRKAPEALPLPKLVLGSSLQKEMRMVSKKIRFSKNPVGVTEFYINDDDDEWIDPKTDASRSRCFKFKTSEYIQKTLYHRWHMAAAFRKGIFTRTSCEVGEKARFDYFVHVRSDKIIHMSEMVRIVESYCTDRRQAKLRRAGPRATCLATMVVQSSRTTTSAVCHKTFCV